MKRLAHLAELEVLGLDGLLDQMVLLWPHLDGRGGGGGGRLLQAVQHLPDVELLHFLEHRIKGDGHFSLTPWYKHAQRRALRPPDFGSHVSASSSAQSPSLEGCDARLVDVQGWMDGSWDGLILGRRLGSLMCVSVAPLLARRLCFPPLPSLSGLMCAPLSQGGNTARCCCCRCCACLTEPRFQRKSRHLSNLSLFLSVSSFHLLAAAPLPHPPLASPSVSLTVGFAPLHLEMVAGMLQRSERAQQRQDPSHSSQFTLSAPTACVRGSKAMSRARPGHGGVFQHTTPDHLCLL